MACTAPITDRELRDAYKRAGLWRIGMSYERAIAVPPIRTSLTRSVRAKRQFDLTSLKATTMDTPSKRLKNQATTAKRTASSLRSLADSSGIDAADRGVLLTAARIVESIAGKTSREAKTLKAAEDKFDRAYKAALPEATKLVNALPCETTLDRLSLVCMNSYNAGYLTQCLNGQEPAERLQRVLKMEVEDSTRDEAASIAYKAAKEGKPVSCYQEDLVGRFNRAHEKHDVVRLAISFDAATAPAADKP